MKRFLAFLLLLCMLFSAVACDGAGNNTSDDSASADSNEGAATDSAASDVPETVDESAFEGEVLKVGYSRVDITPDGPIYLDSNTLLDSILSHIYATCVAVSDGSKTILMYTIDTKNISPDETSKIRMKIFSATKVPSQNITIAPTHNHSAPMLGNLKAKPENAEWTDKVHEAMITAAKEAIADLTDAKIYTATGKTPGMAFVRRWVLADGTYSGIHNGNKSTAAIVAYETEADDTVQVIRFVRDDKKDVLMANWQSHAASAIGLHPNSLTADLVGYARDNAESLDDDVLFALYIGASGNIALGARVPGTKKYKDYKAVGTALGEIIIETCNKMERAHAGAIKVSASSYKVYVRKDDAETVKKAKEFESLKEGSSEYKALLDKYGFNSKYEVEAINKRANSGESEIFYLSAFSFGDLGFVSVPYEMFDTNGVQIKEGSPMKMTFVLTNANGWAGYIPDENAIPHGGYEVYMTKYAFGTAERIVDELLKMLNKQAK